MARNERLGKGRETHSRPDIEGVFPDPPVDEAGSPVRTISNKEYLAGLAGLQVELVKLQEWIKHEGLKVVADLRGPRRAGKGGAIKTITRTA